MKNTIDSRANDLREDIGDDTITNPNATAGSRSFEDVLGANLSRRRFVASSFVLASGAGSLLAGCASTDTKGDDQRFAEGPTKVGFDFQEIEHGFSYNHVCAPDHTAKVLVKWGDPLFEDAPEFDFLNQTVESQMQQFGYNCDYVGFLALTPKDGESDRALLCVNHEYPYPWLSVPNFAGSLDDLTKEQVQISQASMGNSIVEVYRQDGEWYVDRGSKYNRRITALETKMVLTGPAAGHPRMQTNADPSGREVIGTINNCAGGMTPWGTYLTCEENFNYHFGGKLAEGHPETANHERCNVPQNYMGWAQQDPRFDLSNEPQEPNRFGWMVEIDPKDPTSTPKKRTAMGRFKHEGGENILAADRRLVVYMGDDQIFEYLYKFVSRDAVDLKRPENNSDLLDHGTLYVAKFMDEGRIQWMPLDISDPLLKGEFESQGELLIEVRRAAQILGATPMDRPEDVVPNHKTGKVYVMLTNNRKRTEANVANDRVNNVFGHIIEIVEDDNDAASTEGNWEVVVRCGNPNDPTHKAKWNPATTENGWFASPDNAAVDPSGRLWIATDQSSSSKISGTLDGLWALETEGEGRGTGKMFYRAPKGAELTGPCFSDDGESLFMAIQHPGDYDRSEEEKAQGGINDWPEFKVDQPPKPSVVVVTKKAGGPVG